MFKFTIDIDDVAVPNRAAIKRIIDPFPWKMLLI